MDSAADMFAKYLASENINISLETLLINMSLGIVFALILEFTYIRCGNSISNRRVFGKNFLLLTLTTLLIIMVVKSSLALSLGLVGALSIVRFRSAIKEPEELAYLFISISLGLGLGANQLSVTAIAFVVILIAIWLKHMFDKKQDFQNLYLTVSSGSTKTIDLDLIIKALEKHTTGLDLKRYDQSKENLEAAFYIELGKTSDLDKAKKELMKLDKNIKITFIDNRQII